MVKTRTLYLTWAWIGTRSWQTGSRTNGQNYCSWSCYSYASSRA